MPNHDFMDEQSFGIVVIIAIAIVVGIGLLNALSAFLQVRRPLSCSQAASTCP
ncbi:MAG: hypothetical protein AAF639_30920 [Chloroflexota bacterium]